MKNLAQDIKDYSDKTGKDTVSIAKEILVLLEADSSIYDALAKRMLYLKNTVMKLVTLFQEKKQKLSATG